MTSKPTKKMSDPGEERPSTVRIKVAGMIIEVDMMTGVVTAEGACHMHGTVDSDRVHVVEPLADKSVILKLLEETLPSTPFDYLELIDLGGSSLSSRLGGLGNLMSDLNSNLGRSKGFPFGP